MKALAWKAFISIPPYRGRIKKSHALFFARVGVSKELLARALSALRVVRRKIVPLVEFLYNSLRGFDSFTFLVHDESSGAPGRGAHVDLTLYFEKPVDARRLLAGCTHVKAAAETSEIAGINKSALKHGIDSTVWLLCRQSALYLDLIENYKSRVPDIVLLQQIGQHLHFFANMAQILIC